MVSQQTVDLEIAGSNPVGPINNWDSGVAVSKEGCCLSGGGSIPPCPVN